MGCKLFWAFPCSTSLICAYSAAQTSICMTAWLNTLQSRNHCWPWSALTNSKPCHTNGSTWKKNKQGNKILYAHWIVNQTAPSLGVLHVKPLIPQLANSSQSFRKIHKQSSRILNYDRDKTNWLVDPPKQWHSPLTITAHLQIPSQLRIHTQSQPLNPATEYSWVPSNHQNTPQVGKCLRQAISASWHMVLNLLDLVSGVQDITHPNSKAFKRSNPHQGCCLNLWWGL